MRLVDRITAPIEGIKPRQISARELVSKYEAPMMDEPSEVIKSPFSIAEPQPAKYDRFDHFAALHKYGRKPHAEAIAGLLDNFYVDGNPAHLTEAENLIKHLRDL
jgi:hypothetical protein